MRIEAHGHHGHAPASTPTRNVRGIQERVRDGIRRGLQTERPSEDAVRAARRPQRRAELAAERPAGEELRSREAAGRVELRRGHGRGHAHRIGARGLQLSIRGRLQSGLADLHRAERQELRAFRGELHAAARNGEADVGELVAAAPDVLHRLADHLGRGLADMISARLAFLGARTGGAPSGSTGATAPVARPAAAPTEPLPEAAAAAPAAEPTQDAAGAEPAQAVSADAADADVSAPFLVFAQRLHELFSSFQDDTQNLLASLEAFLEAHDADDAEEAGGADESEHEREDDA